MLNRLFRYWFKSIGWSLKGSFENRPDKFIIIIGPHTANMDFVIGILVRSALGIHSTKYLGKSQLFRFPLGILFRALGGYPVVRTKNNNMVDAVTDIFNQHDKFSIALAPEGTRTKVTRLRTGFYHIAKKANIPIYAVGFDYSTKTVLVNTPFYPSDNMEEDFRLLFNFFTVIKGKYPDKGIDMNMFMPTISD